jgi:3-oxoadipate enol-lactonase
MGSFSKVQAPDGTMLRAWTNDGNGIPVVISNGLGASQSAWPTIAARDSGFRVVTWHHRGLGGSERPARAGAIRVEDFASDLGAVMASVDMERALIVGWSFGVNAAFEFAQRQPGRTAGLLAIAGVPGGSLGAMYGPMRMPRTLREPAGQISAQLLPVTGPWLTLLAAAMPTRYPVGPPETNAILREAADVPALRAMLREFAAHDWEWYSRLAVALGEHAPMNVADTSFPVTFLGGRQDAIVASEDIRAVASTIRKARVRILPSGSHLLPMQYPDLMLEELRRLAGRTDLARFS